MTAFFAIAWAWLKSPLGRTVAEIAAAVLLFFGLWWAFAHHYQKQGAERCEARIAAMVEQQKAAQASIAQTAHEAAVSAVAIGQNAAAQAQGAQHEVQAAVGASTPLPPDGLAKWRAGLGRVSAAGSAAPGHSGGSQPAPSVRRP